MPRTYLVEAVEFSGDQRPVRSGMYVRRHEQKFLTWSYFKARTKLWGCWEFLMSGPMDAYECRHDPSAYQRLPWYALPHQIPAGARIERVSGLTFRVTEA